jgi:hypothetical protein
MLCDKCTKIHFQLIEDIDPTLTSEDTADKLFYFHSKDQQCLEKSAAEGCHFCTMMAYYLVLDTKNHCYNTIEPAWARGWVVLWRDTSDAFIDQELQQKEPGVNEVISFDVQHMGKRWLVECHNSYPGECTIS